MKKIKEFIKKNQNFIITISILLGGQAFMYWFLKLLQSNPLFINYYLDDKIPFLGRFIYIYNTFYPFILFSFYFLYQKDKDSYYKGIISGIIGFLICDVIFIFMPTIMYRPPIDPIDPVTDFVLKITYYFDEPPLNCFPSIHCLFCFQVIYSFLFNSCNKKTKLIVTSYALLIIASTLLVKQHFIFDVISAFLICLIANLLERIFHLYEFFKKKKILKI